MALYICPKCRSTFGEPVIERYAGEKWNACPECGDPDFEAAWQCKGCRKDMLFSELVAGYYCPDCVDRAMKNNIIVESFLSDETIRDSFAEFLHEMNWEPWKEDIIV